MYYIISKAKYSSRLICLKTTKEIEFRNFWQLINSGNLLIWRNEFDQFCLFYLQVIFFKRF